MSEQGPVVGALAPILAFMQHQARTVSAESLAWMVAPDTVDILRDLGGRGRATVTAVATEHLGCRFAELESRSLAELTVICTARPTRFWFRLAANLWLADGKEVKMPGWLARIPYPDALVAGHPELGIVVPMRERAGRVAVPVLPAPAADEQRAVAELLGTKPPEIRSRSPIAAKTTWAVLDALRVGDSLTPEELDSRRNSRGLAWFVACARPGVLMDLACVRCPDVVAQLAGRWNGLSPFQRMLLLSAPWQAGRFDRRAVVLRRVGSRRWFRVEPDRLLLRP